MSCIVITMLKYENAGRIKEILQSSGYWENIVICRHGAETLSVIDNQDVNLVICTKKLIDMGYEELNTYLPARVKLVLLTKDVALVPFSSNVTKLIMPFRQEELISIVKSLIPVENKPEKKRKVRTLEEQNIIDSAKELLMNQNDMTEPEAFRYIQKISMDSRSTFVEIAQKILNGQH